MRPPAWANLMTAIFACTFILPVVATSASAASKVSRCTSADHISMAQRGRNGASGQALYRILITNQGPIDCWILMPSAHPVDGTNRILVGQPTLDYPENGWKGSLTLKPHESGFFWYSILYDRLFTFAQCAPSPANGAVIGLAGIGTLYFRTTLPGFNEVCTRRGSTTVSFAGLIH
jgi:hypothetical protein